MSIFVKHERRGPVFEIILNRPQKRNAIDLEMYEQFGSAVAKAGQSEGVRALLIRGEGKVFSGGIDVLAFMQLPQNYGSGWLQKMRNITRDFQSVLNRLEDLEIPVIAMIHGYCLGLGMEIALACDIRLAEVGTMMGLPETRLGLIPDVGGTTRLVRLVGPARAKELIFTGRQIDAVTAFELGIVNYVVPEGELDNKALELVAEIEQAAPLAVGMAKRVIDGLSDIERGLALEGWAQSQLIGTKDFTEAVQAFMEKRPAVFTGK